MKIPDAFQTGNRWFHPTPDRCVVGLLAVEGLLWVWEWFQWSPKGWPVLIALATIGAAMLLMLVWLAVALIFSNSAHGRCRCWSWLCSI